MAVSEGFGSPGRRGARRVQRPLRRRRCGADGYWGGGRRVSRESAIGAVQPGGRFSRPPSPRWCAGGSGRASLHVRVRAGGFGEFEPNVRRAIERGAGPESSKQRRPTQRPPQLLRSDQSQVLEPFWPGDLLGRASHGRRPPNPTLRKAPRRARPGHLASAARSHFGSSTSAVFPSPSDPVARPRRGGGGPLGAPSRPAAVDARHGQDVRDRGHPIQKSARLDRRHRMIIWGRPHGAELVQPTRSLSLQGPGQQLLLRVPPAFLGQAACGPRVGGPRHSPFTP